MDKKSLLTGFASGIVLACIVFYFAFYISANELQQKASNNRQSGGLMKIKLTSVFVNDQAKALQFYTEKLGFVKKMDLPVGEYSWQPRMMRQSPHRSACPCSMHVSFAGADCC